MGVQVNTAYCIQLSLHYPFIETYWQLMNGYRVAIHAKGPALRRILSCLVILYIVAIDCIDLRILDPTQASTLGVFALGRFVLRIVRELIDVKLSPIKLVILHCYAIAVATDHSVVA
jgi:hypothetical protein